MMKDDDNIRLKHMLDAANKILEFTNGITQKDFEADEKLSLAVTRLIEIIGEAANNISEEIKENSPDLPWRSIVAIRNRLIHGYFDLDMNIIWNIISKDIPSLAKSLTAMIR